MSKRKITQVNNLNFDPFDRYGKVIPGMTWHKISFDKKRLNKSNESALHSLESWKKKNLKNTLILFI